MCPENTLSFSEVLFPSIPKWECRRGPHQRGQGWEEADRAGIWEMGMGMGMGCRGWVRFRERR